jgi:hypothetical protein
MWPNNPKSVKNVCAIPRFPGTTLRNSTRWELYPMIQQRRRIFGNNMACPKLCSRVIPCCWRHEEESTHHHHPPPPNILEFCLSPHQHYQAGLTRWQIGRGRGTVSILLVCFVRGQTKENSGCGVVIPVGAEKRFVHGFHRAGNSPIRRKGHRSTPDNGFTVDLVLSRERVLVV